MPLNSTPTAVKSIKVATWHLTPTAVKSIKDGLGNKKHMKEWQEGQDGLVLLT